MAIKSWRSMCATTFQSSGIVLAEDNKRLANFLGTEKGKSNAAIVLTGADRRRSDNLALGVASQESIFKNPLLNVPRVTHVFLSDFAPLKSTPMMVVSKFTVCSLTLC